MIRTIALGMAAMLLVPWMDAAGQRARIDGVVRDTAGAPVPLVEITSPGGVVIADTLGRFHLDGLTPGVVGLGLRRIGYRSTSWNGTLAAGATLPLILVMTPVPRDLDPVIVDAASEFTARQLRGFYLRRQRGSGHFLTREQIAQHDQSRLTEVLRSRIPSVSVSGGSGRSRLRLRGQRCPPLVWIDGAAMPAAEFDLDMIQASNVAAVEVYLSPGMVPVEFTLPMSYDACGGSIIIWSRYDMRSDEQRADELLALREIGTARIPVYRAEEVDEPAGIDSSTLAAAAYPDSLQAFGVTGSVVAQLVVDTTGSPVAGSIEIVSATHPAFALAASRAIAVSRFRPARRQGRLVRQVLVVPFTFTGPTR